MKHLFIVLLLCLGLSPVWAQKAVIVPATTASAPINISTATTTQLVAGIAGQSIYVTAVDVIAAGVGNIQFTAGTGGICGTATVNITGNYALTAQVGFTKGTGNGALWVVPQGSGLCAVTSAAVGMFGSLAYAQF